MKTVTNEYVAIIIDLRKTRSQEVKKWQNKKPLPNGNLTIIILFRLLNKIINSPLVLP